jgi:uncharacterized metal-binding protein YceD (DUF177 family)
MTPELSRRIPLDRIGTDDRVVEIEADESERAALAKRFALDSVDALTAKATLVASASGVAVRGSLHARVVQSCAVTGDPVAATVVEDFALKFLADVDPDADDIELRDDDCDVLPLEGGAVDLGEAVAQTFGLALDPFPRSPAARAVEDRTWRAGPDAGPFAALKGLK